MIWHMMQALIFILAWLVMSNANPDRSQIDHGCKINFEVLNAGLVTTGSLEAKVVTNTFDPNTASGEIFIVAYPQSIDTGIAIRDKHLKRSDYFDVERHAEIRVHSKGIEKKSRSRFIGKFSLSIKETVKEIKIPFSLRRYKDKLTYEGTFTINRMDFRIGEPSITLADTVTIKFHVTQPVLNRLALVDES
jgi:polyisoprenoid-binding protein YceI